MSSHPLSIGTFAPPSVEPAAAATVKATAPWRSPKFSRDHTFQAELKRRVDEFFEKTGRRRRDVPAMYLKTAILFTAFAASYYLLVFHAHHWWTGVPLVALLGFVTAFIGLNVQHDGGHQAYSERAWVNRLMAYTLDLIGGSSYIWHYKHGVYHHTYVNITHEDTDVDLGALARLTPHQKRYWFHRWQHLYIWPLYGFAAAKWHLFDDFKDVIRGKLGEHKLPRPKGWNLAGFLFGKAFFLTVAFGIPLMLHEPWVVCLFYALGVAVLGGTLSVVFQLAHAVEDAEFPMPLEETGDMENAWAVHQVQTTVNFSRRSKVAAWLLGGLNFQVEHHLLPKICHVNFPALAEVVEGTCREFDLKYNEHKTFWAGIGSHFRWLREMGKPDAAR